MTGPAVRSASAQLVFVVLGACVLAVFIGWTEHDGGYAPEQWLPATLVLLALLGTSSASAAARQRLRVARFPIALLSAYTCFSYVTIAWAGSRGDALDGANRTALYAVAFALFVALADRRLRIVIPPAWASAVVVIALVHFLRAASAQGPRGYFIEGRLSSPIRYPDAQAAILLMAALTLLTVAARRESPAWLRAASGGLACAGFDLGILAQSRGSVAALPLALVALLALSRNALRSMVAMALAVVTVAPAIPGLLDVYHAVISGHGYAPTLTHARTVLCLSAAGGLVGFACLALVDSRVAIPAQVTRMIRRALTLAVVLGGTAAVAVVLAFLHPASRVDHVWTNFTTNTAASPETIHLASGLGTSRYDVWRIALRQFAAHPIGGVGADNYLAGYLRERRTVETARYPESVILRALSETGVVGALLFFGFLTAAFVAAVRGIRSELPLGTAVVASAPVAYWLFHASVDWFWEFPALTGPALAFLALASVGGKADAKERLERSSAVLIWGVATAGCLAIAVVVFSCWVSLRQIDQAAKESSPARAYALLDNAARWNPLSNAPQLTEAAVAANVLDRPREVSALHAALRKTADDWYAHLMLGIAAGREGRLRVARLELQKARSLSPREPVVIYAQRNLRVGNALSEAEIARVFEIRSSTLRGVTQR